ncbi:proteasome-type protease, partial [Acinetobacter baumannii]
LNFWRKTGERVVVLMTAGNLAVTQAVISVLNEQLTAHENDPDQQTIMTVPSMFRVARLVGEAIRDVRLTDGPALEASKAGFNASFILGG